MNTETTSAAGNTKPRFSRHHMMMALCVVGPLALLAVLWLTGAGGNWLWIGFLVAHPLLHLFMMKGKGDENDHDES